MKRTIAALAIASFALIAAPPAQKTKVKSEPSTATDTAQPVAVKKVHKTKKHTKTPAGTETPATPGKQ